MTELCPLWIALCAGAGLLLSGCVTRVPLEARIEQISAALADAESVGAMRCAPRELAIAQSQLAFGRLEREQGSGARAVAHLDIAEQNVRAARLLSQPERCSGSIEAGPGHRPQRPPVQPPP